ncbi:hypothetical protein GCM10010193_70060 [Kitasatospora atroaurantiaca]|uniref:Uncharacterized protein n=1 Tax=Kitasatospora atroaurantiaca TaxID=285545 RepID=A0A561END2_9ACTN|nr:DUF6248 family natural product biosynthesis protein [Kitasatospora atroaurantiaca]TWE17092.1 hypothetical protein FB465_2097 [Kitasatospora atroaurantiaca]
MLTTADAAWIRQHSWTQGMRETYAEVPEVYTACACRWGASGHCEHGRHNRCHTTGRPVPAAVVCRTDGETPVPGRPALWLTGRDCRWQCPCGCHVPGGL